MPVINRPPPKKKDQKIGLWNFSEITIIRVISAGEFLHEVIKS